MHQREKIQAVFESVELEKEELKRERDELRKERVAITKDRDLLVRAIKKIGSINTEGAADISHAANKIKTIKTNTDNIVEESSRAIRAVKRQKIFASITTSLITLILAFTIGLGSAHISYTELLREKVLAYKIKNIEEREAELKKTTIAVIELQRHGLEVYTNAIVLPKNYKEMIGETENGKPALFID